MDRRGDAPPRGKGETEQERAARVLAERARRLAETPRADAAETVAALAFDAGGERYAIAMSAALRVEAVRHVARLPGTPPGHLGLVNLDGRPCPFVDVPALLGVAGAAAAPRRWAVVLGDRAPALALAADGVAVEPLAPELLVGEGIRRGVTADARVVLDARALLREVSR